jgi:hypothetical protein
MMRAVALVALFLLGALASAHGDAAALAPCARCHMAYPAAMLPQRSWTAILASLSSHFGAKVNLAGEELAAVGAYLAAHAADGPEATPEDRHFLDPVAPEPAPTRITQTRWWQDRHADLGGSEIARPTDCRSCHKDGFEK